MDTSFISNVLGSNQQQSDIQKIGQKAGARLQSAVAAIASAAPLNKASDDIASLSQAALLRAETTGLKQAANNLARASSLTQVADDGLSRIAAALQQAQALAAQSQDVDDSTRKALDTQFQQLKSVVDDVSNNTKFGGQKLLDGSISDNAALSLNALIGLDTKDQTSDSKLSLGNFSSSNLLRDNSNLRSAASSADVELSVGSALAKTVEARTNNGAFIKAIDATSAAFETAINNQAAATSTLTEEDLTEKSTETSRLNLQENATIVAATQGNKLTPALLKLIA